MDGLVRGEMEIRTYAVGTDLGKGVCVRMLRRHFEGTDIGNRVC